MAYIDCFNGDADGICALTQLRLAQPVKSKLVTGVKRDISLLSRVVAEPNDHITVLDVSLDKNRKALLSVLEQGAQVFYCDHHFAGEVPEHKNLTNLINTTADVCTSLLINQHLNGVHLDWAVVGTFGDNLKKSAQGLAKPLRLSESKLLQLENLGCYLNYNGYGSTLEDLHFHPAELFQLVVQHDSPFAFVNEDQQTFMTLEEGYHGDMKNALNTQADFNKSHAAVYLLPNQPWARRVSGVYGNELANRNPDRANAVVTERGDGSLVVSVRAPLNNKQGADSVCRQFESGGGRAGAAGINHLPKNQLATFVDVFERYYRA